MVLAVGENVNSTGPRKCWLTWEGKSVVRECGTEVKEGRSKTRGYVLVDEISFSSGYEVKKGSEYNIPSHMLNSLFPVGELSGIVKWIQQKQLHFGQMRGGELCKSYPELAFSINEESGAFEDPYIGERVLMKTDEGVFSCALENKLANPFDSSMEWRSSEKTGPFYNVVYSPVESGSKSFPFVIPFERRIRTKTPDEIIKMEQAKSENVTWKEGYNSVKSFMGAVLRSSADSDAHITAMNEKALKDFINDASLDRTRINVLAKREGEPGFYKYTNLVLFLYEGETRFLYRIPIPKLADFAALLRLNRAQIENDRASYYHIAHPSCQAHLPLVIMNEERFSGFMNSCRRAYFEATGIPHEYKRNEVLGFLTLVPQP